jgi:hypothetical protein
MKDDYSIKRFRAGLISNIRGAIIILDQNDIQCEKINLLKGNVQDYINNLYFNTDIKVDDEMLMEFQRMAENIIAKPYQDWMFKEKTKIRHNFPEEAKRTWNRIKKPAGRATKIEPEIFADHYSQI